MFKLCLTVILLGIVTQINCENLPVFFWGPQTSIFLPAVNPLSSEEFGTLIKSQTNENTVKLVFVENNLSVEDLSQCKLKSQTCFENLRKVQDKTYLTAVEDPVEALKASYGSDQQKSIFLTNDGDLSDKIDAADGKIIFIYLDEVEEKQDFATHDELINKIYNSISSKYDNVMAIYTAQNPSFAYPRQLIRKARQTDEVKQRVIVNDKFLFALSGMSYKEGANEPKIIDIEGLALSVNLSSETLMEVGLQDADHHIEMKFELSAGNWKVIELSYNNLKYHSQYKMSAPQARSFTCGAIEFSNVRNHIYLDGVQIQPFFARAETDKLAFGISSDCVGYFSAGIWGGLFVIILLLIILSFGLTAIMDIRTMDRFDDPKGKTIIVNTAE